MDSAPDSSSSPSIVVPTSPEPLALPSDGESGGPRLVSFKADEVDIATRPADGDVQPRIQPYFNFAISGVIVFALFIGFVLVQGMKPSTSVVLVLLGILGVLGITAIIVNIVRKIRRSRRRKKGGRPSNLPSRLRLIGDEKKTAAFGVVDNLDFEPVVLRSIYAVYYAVEKKDGTLEMGRGRRKRRLKLRRGLSPANRATLITCAILGAVFIAAVHFFILRPGVGIQINYFEIMFGIALGTALAAFIRPTYIRIVPGAMDIFQFGFLGSGTPEVERWDLRRCRICVDLDFHLVRIEDLSRPANRVMFITLRQTIGGGPFAGHSFLLGARSTHPTPPVPMNALSD